MKLLLPILLLFTSTIFGQINVYLTIEPPSDAYSYDGWVMAYVSSGQSPYTYVWNDTLITSGDPFFPEYDTLWNLCSGVYTLDIYDANNDSLHLDFFLTSTDLSFNGTGGATDTLDYGVQSCALDYSIPVDSARMVNVSLLSNHMITDADSIFVQWNVYQGSLTTEIYDTLIGYFPLGSDFVVNAAIYCPDSSHTQVKVIQVYGLIDSTLGIDSNVFSLLDVYPNPFTDKFTLSGLNSGSGELKIYDLQGKVVYSLNKQFNSAEMIAPDLLNGLYILEYTSDNKRLIQRIVKQ